MAATNTTLADAFYETLKDVYCAEKQSVRALKTAALPNLKQAFDDHREDSAPHVERREQIFEIIGKTARAKGAPDEIVASLTG